MLKIIGSFLLGVYVGQEYGKLVPNVKNVADEILTDIKRTEFYKDINERYFKKNK